MEVATDSRPVTLSVEISEATYQMWLEEIAGDQGLGFDQVADKAIAQWVLNRRNHRRMQTQLMLESA